ncbi:hypothetical protein CYV19_17595 [Natronobacterium gregoryi SP2]|uniref:Uncharacterized protein n=1 Tax=Natronobacterium gregoryi (strain ATCC 43098 / DSM 3393 / CCM 3738 / CIP 104747 / IAM 13177 / JCM 8860 / NBRC 102187 / NCIMB 2189 / SP2) TaxID=797304 RepID=A0A2J4JAK4_NATGS|nr:hypothetical protein CYV19_17595 [Natronobacterium gregoryi SP2]
MAGYACTAGSNPVVSADSVQQSTLGGVLVPSQPSTDGSNRATPPDSTDQFRLGPPLVLWQALTDE